MDGWMRVDLPVCANGVREWRLVLGACLRLLVRCCDISRLALALAFLLHRK